MDLQIVKRLGLVYVWWNVMTSSNVNWSGNLIEKATTYLSEDIIVSWF